LIALFILRYRDAGTSAPPVHYARTLSSPGLKRLRHLIKYS